MYIRRYLLSKAKSRQAIKLKKVIENKPNGGVGMENVITIDKYIENTQTDIECEWDILQKICQKAIKRKGVTKNQIKKTSERLLREVRSEK